MSPRVIVAVLSMFLLCGIGLGAVARVDAQDADPEHDPGTIRLDVDGETGPLISGGPALQLRMGCCGVFDPTECRCVQIRLPLEDFRPDDWERRDGFVLVPERQADQLVGVHDGLVQAYGVISVYARPRR